MRVYQINPDEDRSASFSTVSAIQTLNNLNEDGNEYHNPKKESSVKENTKRKMSLLQFSMSQSTSDPDNDFCSSQSNRQVVHKNTKCLYEITEHPEEEHNPSLGLDEESQTDNNLQNRLISPSSLELDRSSRKKDFRNQQNNLRYPQMSKSNSKNGKCNNCQKSIQTYNKVSRKRQFTQKEDCSEEMEVDDESSKKFMMTLTAKDNFMDTLMKWTIFAIICAGISPMVKGDDRVGLTSNNWERPNGMPKIAHLEVMCGNQHMEVHLAFDKPFHGLVTSKGMYGQQDCVYVRPRTGKNTFVFNIYYDKCGTKPDNNGKFYENTVVVQYDEELIEAWDEAKRLRCEWFNDYEKTATKTSPMVISDLEVVELNFHGDNVDCWMEIQDGKGPWAPPLNGIAPLGSTLTMVIAVKDPSGEFDMRVKDCEASDGQTGRNLPLSDPEGCIVRPKLIGKFSKLKQDDGRATVMTYAFISAFKFPDMLNVHLRCTVEICRHGCPDHCGGIHNGTPAKNNLLGAYSDQEPAVAQSQNSETKVSSPNKLPDSDEHNNGDKNGLGPNTSESASFEKPDIHKEAMHHNSGALQSPIFPQHPQHQPQPQPPQQSNGPVHLRPQNSGELFAPPQMRPPPPPQHFAQHQHQPRPQRHHPPHGRPGPPHLHSKFPPGLLRQRPDILNFPLQPPGPLPSRFTGTIKHTIGPDIRPPEQNFMEEQKRHHEQMVQNLLLKPEPKIGITEELSQRSGEISKESKEDQEKETSKEVEKKNEEKDESKEKETEMLMEAQPLKDEAGQGKVEKDKITSKEEPLIPTAFPKGPRNLKLRRRRRSVTGTSDFVGVQGAFRVVSQADLNFVMNSSVPNSTPTIVLRGKMSQGDPIYGICLPRVGFGVVFFGLGLATLVAIIIASFLAYAHYSVQHYKGQVQQHLSKCSNPVTNIEGITDHPSMPMPLPHQMLPMVILKKIWY